MVCAVATDHPEPKGALWSSQPKWCSPYFKYGKRKLFQKKMQLNKMDLKKKKNWAGVSVTEKKKKSQLYSVKYTS